MPIYGNAVTDPELLRKLNAGSSKYGTPVTDPELLKKLDGEDNKSSPSAMGQITNALLNPAHGKDLASYLGTIGSLAVPEFKAAKLIGDAASPITKALANYGGSIAQNSGLGAILNKLQGGSAKEGAETAGATTAVTHPLLNGIAQTSNPLLKILGSSAVGGLAGGALASQAGIPQSWGDIGGAVAGGVLAPKSTYKDLAIQKILGNLSPEERAQAVSNQRSSNALGVPLTATESINTPVSRDQQSALQGTPESAMTLYNFQRGRKPQEQQAIKGLLDKMSPQESYENIEKPNYAIAYNKEVPQNDLAKLLSQNSRLKDAFNKVNKDVDFKDQLKNLPLTNIQYIDNVKQYLDNKIGSFLNKGEDKRAGKINSVRKSLVNLADEASPEYALARQAAEKRLTREGIENSINQSDLSGRTFYDKWLKPDEQFKQLRFHLRDRNNIGQDTPEQKKLDLMRSTFAVMDDLIDKKGSKVLSDEPHFGLKHNVLETMNNLLYGKYNKSVADFITDPKWNEQFNVLDKIKDRNKKAAYLADALSRASAIGSVNLQGSQ